jgi:uncharacterized delta-60 repeat protein
MRRPILAAAALLAPALFSSLSGEDVAAATVPLPYLGEVRDVVVQSDHKTVVAFAPESADRFTVVRLLADGVTLDPSFGGDGIVETVLLPTGFSVIHDIALQPDGRIVAVGYANTVPGPRNFGIVRYRNDGSLDPTFGGGDGIAITNLTGLDSIQPSMALTPNGSIIVAAYTELPDGKLVLARHRNDGSPDPAFGTGGLAVHDMVGSGFRVHDVVSDAAGNAVVGGGKYDHVAPGAQQQMLARITPTGALDPTFGAGGLATWAQGAGYLEVRSVAIQSDGRIVAAGFTDDGRKQALARYLPSGQPDPSFGTGGYVTTPIAGSLIGFDKPGNDVAVLRDGRIAVSGEMRSHAPHIRLAVVTSSGVPDPAFDGDDGTVELPLGVPGVLDGGGFLALTRTGVIVVAGTDRVGGSAGTPEVVAVPSLAPSADLSTIVTASPNPAPAGPVEFRVGVRNDGPAAASAVSLTFELSQNVTAVHATQGACHTPLGFVATCNFGSLEPGREIRVTATTFVTGFEEGLFGTAQVHGTGYDPDPADNTATAEVVIAGPSG